jgi:cytochrome c oxidase subunit IV
MNAAAGALMHAQGEAGGAVHAPIRTYLTVWGWLFILSALAYFVDVSGMTGWIKAVLLSGFGIDEGRVDRGVLHASAV